MIQDRVLQTKDLDSELTGLRYGLSILRNHYNSKCEEVKEMLNQLSKCETELTTAATSLVVMTQLKERLQSDLTKANSKLKERTESLRISSQIILGLKKEVRLLEKQFSDTTRREADIIETFKKSTKFSALLADIREKERCHIYNVEMRGLGRHYIGDGFTRGFVKGVRLMQRRTGAIIANPTPSQASTDPPSPWNEEEMSSAYQSFSG